MVARVWEWDSVPNNTLCFSSAHRWTSAFLLDVHRLCGAIEGRLSHFLQHWLRMGWQSVISQKKIPWNTLPWLGTEPGEEGLTISTDRRMRRNKAKQIVDLFILMLGTRKMGESYLKNLSAELESFQWYYSGTGVPSLALSSWYFFSSRALRL